MPKKKKKNVSYKVVLTSAITVLVVLAAFFSVYVFSDLKKVQQSVYNIHQEIKTTNEKLEKYSALDEQSAQKTVKFTEATKNWQIYHDTDFNFQMKSPASWGQFHFNLRNVDDEEKMIYSHGKFHLLGESSFLEVEVVDHQFTQDGFSQLSNEDLYSSTLRNMTGECNNQTFEALKDLSIGEVRNCYVRENILNQKLLIYRLVNDDLSSLMAVYPRENYYIKILHI